MLEGPYSLHSWFQNLDEQWTDQSAQSMKSLAMARCRRDGGDRSSSLLRAATMVSLGSYCSINCITSMRPCIAQQWIGNKPWGRKKKEKRFAQILSESVILGADVAPCKYIHFSKLCSFLKLFFLKAISGLFSSYCWVKMSWMDFFFIRSSTFLFSFFFSFQHHIPFWSFISLSFY